MRSNTSWPRKKCDVGRQPMIAADQDLSIRPNIEALERRRTNELPQIAVVVSGKQQSYLGPPHARVAIFPLASADINPVLVCGNSTFVVRDVTQKYRPRNP